MSEGNLLKHCRRTVLDAECGSQDLGLYSGQSSAKVMGRLSNHYSQAVLGMWSCCDTDAQLQRCGQPACTENKLCIQGVDPCEPLPAFHCFSEMSSLSSNNKQVLSVWELFSPLFLFSLLCPHFVSLAGLWKAEGLCADVPGERPAPLPWENMWSGSVYAGTLSSCLPHSMLMSASPRWQCLPLLPQKEKAPFVGHHWSHTFDPFDKQETHFASMNQLGFQGIVRMNQNTQRVKTYC